MLLEREPQLAELVSLAEGLDASGGRVVLVHGDAGAGKTSLVAEFAERAPDRSRVLIGTCDDLITPQPLGAIWDVAAQAPNVADALQSNDRRLVHDSLLDLLSRPFQPTILIIEDCHWADEATLDAMAFVGRRIGRSNGILLLTYRARAVDANHPLRQVIGTIPAQHITRIGIGPLSEHAVETILGASDYAVDQVMSLTGGNALYVTELARSHGAIPASVQDAVLARVGKLSPETRKLVQLVSVSPGWLEAAATDVAATPTAEHLAESARQDLVHLEGGRLAFRHEVVRRAVEASLDDATRREMNEAVLTALRGLADPARLAHHAVQARNVEVLVEVAPEAARAAMAIGSYREAVAHFRSLEPHLDRFPAAEQGALLEDWARTLYYLDDPVPSAAIIERAIAIYRGLEDREATARALAFSTRPLRFNSRPDDARANADEAIALLEAEPSSEGFAYVVAQRAWLEWVAGMDTQLALRYAKRAIALAEAAGQELIVVRASQLEADIEFSLGDRGALNRLETIRRRAAEGGFHFEESLAIAQMAGLSADIREIARARDLAIRARETAVRHEMRTHELYAQAILAEVLLWQGDWEAAEAAAEDVLDSSIQNAMIGWRVLGNIQARRGQPGSRSALERAWDLAIATDELQNLDPAATALAEYLWISREDDPELLAELREIFAAGIRRGVPWPSGALTFWLWKLGEIDEVPESTSDFYGWIIGGEWRDAAEFWRARGAPFDEALALMHGDEEAQRAAVRIFEDLGADAAAARLRRDLAARGVVVPRGAGRATRRHAAGLTARQAEILDLLAEGMTNAEIADRLFLSPRTVENHVAAVLLKLDAANRNEAVAAARQRGILTHS